MSGACRAAQPQLSTVTLTVELGVCQPDTGQYSDSWYMIDFVPGLPVGASYSFSLDLGVGQAVQSVQGKALGQKALDAATGTVRPYISSGGMFTPSIDGTITVNGRVCRVSVEGSYVTVPPCTKSGIKATGMSWLAIVTLIVAIGIAVLIVVLSIFFGLLRMTLELSHMTQPAPGG